MATLITVGINYNHILLIHPLGYSLEAAKRDISRMANIMPPLGIASIAAYLEKRRIKCSIVDCFACPDSDSLIRDYIIDKKPAFIGISCTTSSFYDGIRISKLVKSINRAIKVIFGGPHVSALKTEVLQKSPVIDFVVVGEGEETLAELIANDGNPNPFIQGIAYRDRSGEIVFTGYRKKGIELDALPFPAYEKLKGYPGAYKLPIFNYPKVPNSSCISSRGCPYNCSYCDRSVFRRSFRFNSAQYMYEHLSYLKKYFGIRHINFYDDLFTFKRKRIEDFTNMMINGPLQMTFNCAVRAEHIDLDLLRQMKAAGCWMVSLGIETGDENLLAQHRQPANLNMLAEKIRLIKKAGIRTKGLLMMGLPGETEASIQKSMDYVFSLPIDDFNLAKFTPFPGSPVYENIHEMGEFDENWEKMDCMHFLFVPKGITKERMEKLFIEFYKNHFTRPKVLLGYIAMLWRSPDSWLRFLKNAVNFIRFARSNKRLGSEYSQVRMENPD
jgi:anaerobic magnesium-protoporphyrin IX monomethyl ester cyclase